MSVILLASPPGCVLLKKNTHPDLKGGKLLLAHGPLGLTAQVRTGMEVCMIPGGDVFVMNEDDTKRVEDAAIEAKMIVAI